MQELFQTLSTEYPCSRYDLISCNCNHFTADACRRLGLQAPDYLNKVANTGEKIMNFGLGMLSAFGSMLEEQNKQGRNGNGSVGGSNSNAGGPEFQIVEGHWSKELCGTRCTYVCTGSYVYTWYMFVHIHVVLPVETYPPCIHVHTYMYVCVLHMTWTCTVWVWVLE